MKFNIASPATGSQRMFEIDDEKMLARLNDKRLAQEIEGSLLGDQFDGYLFKVTGGQDKQGFAMKEGVHANARVSLLVARGTIGFQAWRGRSGERRRKSVRGCIIGPDISVLNLIIVKKGDKEIEGLTDVVVPRRLGPKRASKIRKLFALEKRDDVKKYVIRRELPAKEGKKKRFKAPKIQRLVTPIALQRRRRKLALVKQRREQSKEDREAHQQLLNRRKVVALQRRKSRVLRQRAAEEKSDRALEKQAKADDRRRRLEERRKKNEARRARQEKKKQSDKSKAKAKAKPAAKKQPAAKAKPTPKTAPAKPAAAKPAAAKPAAEKKGKKK